MPLSAPQVIVYAPPEEFDQEPCLSYSAPDQISGLPNERKLRGLSLTHALLQIFMALQEITDEMPVEPIHENTRLFVSTVRKIHTSEAVSAEMMSDLVQLLESGSMSTIQTTTSAEPNDIAFVENYETVIQFLIQGVLVNSKMGKRFRMDTTSDKLSASSSSSTTNLLSKFNNNNATNASTDSVDSQSRVDESRGSTLHNSLQSGLNEELATTSSTSFSLSIPLNGYAESESVDVVSLIRKRFGLKPPPIFFFGGPTTTASANSKRSDTNNGFASPDISRAKISEKSFEVAEAPIPKTLLTHLPDLLVLIFKRPLTETASSTNNNGSKSKIFHRTSVEVPMDLDLGFAVSPEATQTTSNNNNKKLNTLYRLHGFVTQTEGRFITYTRLRGSSLFYKCEDDVIGEGTDLGGRVNSKGVVMALYKVNSAKK
ncbi:hypothetical protein BDR26DRAFT_1005395 [Obelidium mucronatum]|nr:hypothetical protein BDR26DRAFT_1005395 [Obelidium mucronatum]